MSPRSRRMQASFRAAAPMFLAHAALAAIYFQVPALGVHIQRNVGITAGQFGLLLAAWAIGGFIVASASGAVVGRLGARTVVLLGPVGSFVLVGLGIIPGFGLIPTLVVMAMLGGCYGALAPATAAAIARSLDSRDWGIGMGLKQTGVTVGAAVGVTSAALLDESIGWQAAMLIVAFFGLSLGCLAWILFPANDGQERRATDGPRLNAGSLVSTYFVSLLLSGTSGVVVGYLALFLVSSGVTTVVAATAVGVALIAGAVGRIALGVIGDLLGPINRGLGMLIPTAVGAISLGALAASGSTLHDLYPVVAALGIATLGWPGLQQAALIDLAGVDRAARATGINGSVGYLGNFVAPLAFGFLVDGWSFQSAWGALAMLQLVGFAAVIGQRRWLRPAVKPQPAG